MFAYLLVFLISFPESYLNLVIDLEGAKDIEGLSLDKGETSTLLLRGIPLLRDLLEL